VRETEEEASASGLLFRLFPATIHIVFRLGRRHGETHSTGARPLYIARRT